MIGHNPVHPPGWMRPSGFTHGMSAQGRVIVTAGQVGWNPANGAIESDDFAEQAAQALHNVVAILRAAGAGPQHLVRLTWFVTSRDEYWNARPALGAAYREIIGKNYPAMSVIVVSGLLEQRAKVEIEATAVAP
jgi:enamine deaminase RidA (YjgF/YER057c/UK114 family)